MTLRKILKNQEKKRYKTLIFLVSLENSELSTINEVFKKEKYDFIDIVEEIKKGNFDLEKFNLEKLNYLKLYFNSKKIVSNLMIVNNIEILISMLEEKEYDNFIYQLSYDNFTDSEKNQTIFLMTDILKFQKIDLKNEDDESKRIHKIEKIKL